MKAKLLATTALAAVTLSPISAAFADDPIQVDVKGFVRHYFGYANNKFTNDGGDDPQNVNVTQDSEIIFTGRTSLDNGLTVGIWVELEAATDGDQIDESYMFLESSLGRVNIGSENSAGYLLQTAPPDVGLGFNTGDQTYYLANPTGGSGFRTPFRSVKIESAAQNDAETLTYLSPRFSGLRFGISYIPHAQQDDTGVASQTGFAHDGVSGGLNYSKDFDGVKLDASATLHWANAPNGVNNAQNPWAYTAGFNVGVGPFSGGIAWAHQVEGAVNAAGTFSTEGYGGLAGVSYTDGPFSTSANFWYGRREGVVGDAQNEEDTTVGAGVSGRYFLGPGIDVRGTLGWGQYDGELADGAGVSTNAAVFAVGAFNLTF